MAPSNSAFPVPSSAFENAGVLFVVATPLGHLQDITLRALEVLRSSDLIAAEGVEHTRALCRHFGIGTRVTRYNQHNERTLGPRLLLRLQKGGRIALVTNAGTPGVSDPGLLLVRQALQAGIRVTPVPGPSAVTAAISVSGLRAERFVFAGFLSGRQARRRRELEELAGERRTLVFFEAPHRIREMLADLLEILGDRDMVLLREMTKLHEEIIHGTVRSVLGRLREDRTRGEFTLVVAGKQEEETSREAPGLQKRIEKLLNQNIMSLKDAARKIADEEGLPWRKVYRACLLVRRKREEEGPAD
ncbi:MAG: 16S rRNA (cytidine(1402)-2'-O)-methyltransferase [Thermodesulfobacteriota bacterium]